MTTTTYHGPTPGLKAQADDRARRMYSNKQVYTPLPHPDAIDDQAIRLFHEQGFIAIENVFTPDEVARYLQAVHDTIVSDDGSLGVTLYEPGVDPSTLTLPQRVLAVRKLFLFVNKVPSLAPSAAHPIVMDICRKLLGQDIILHQDMALLKPPGGGVEKPWHQDAAYFKVKPAQSVIGSWIALDEATLDNGCMHAIPGSHKLGPRPHYHDYDCQLPDDDIDVTRDVAIPLKPGGAMFFSGLLFHGTPPNNSQSRRQALQYHYRAKTSSVMSQEEVAEMFHDQSGYAGCQPIDLPKRPIAQRAP